MTTDHPNLAPLAYYHSWVLFEWAEWHTYYSQMDSTSTYGLVWAIVPEYSLGTERWVNGAPGIYCKAGQDIHVHSALPPCPRCSEQDNLLEDDGRVICGHCHLRYDL